MHTPHVNITPWCAAVLTPACRGMLVLKRTGAAHPGERWRSQWVKELAIFISADLNSCFRLTAVVSSEADSRNLLCMKHFWSKEYGTDVPIKVDKRVQMFSVEIDFAIVLREPAIDLIISTTEIPERHTLHDVLRSSVFTISSTSPTPLKRLALLLHCRPKTTGSF